MTFPVTALWHTTVVRRCESRAWNDAHEVDQLAERRATATDDLPERPSHRVRAGLRPLRLLDTGKALAGQGSGVPTGSPRRSAHTPDSFAGSIVRCARFGNSQCRVATEAGRDLDRNGPADRGHRGDLRAHSRPGESAVRSRRRGCYQAWFGRPEREKCLRMSLETEQQVQDFLQFEGNAQSLRLVAKLQVLADDKGLNLTFGTLSALCKYLASSDRADKRAANHACRKPGYFASEQDIVRQIRGATVTGEARHPICFLVEAADDVVYLAADVEDAVKKGVLSWREVEHELQASTSDSVKEVMASQASILRVGRTEVPANLDDDGQ